MSSWFSNPAFQMSYSDWPSDILQGYFYKEYIMGRPYQNHYAALKNLNYANSSDIDLFIAERLVKKHFLSIRILTHTDVQELQATEKISLASYISQLGGALNLWAGITVVVVIELIELLYFFITERGERPISQWRCTKLTHLYEQTTKTMTDYQNMAMWNHWCHAINTIVSYTISHLHVPVRVTSQTRHTWLEPVVAGPSGRNLNARLAGHDESVTYAHCRTTRCWSSLFPIDTEYFHHTCKHSSNNILGWKTEKRSLSSCFPDRTKQTHTTNNYKLINVELIQ